MRLAAFVLAVSLLAQTRPPSAAEALALRNLDEIAASPNSPALLYSIARDGWFALDTSARVAAIPASASSLRWSPDGRKLAFIESSAGQQILSVLDWSTRAVTRVANFQQGNAFLSGAGNRLAWSPDSLWLAFTGTLEPPPAPQDPVVITRLQYKSRTALSDNRRSHIFLVAAAGGTPKDITPGPHDNHSIDWTAGPELVFVSNREPDPDANFNLDIYAVNPHSGVQRQLTRTPGVEYNPRLSPSGDAVLFTATTRKVTTIDSVAEDAHAYTVPISGGAFRQVNPKLDRRVSGAQWDASGASVLYSAGDHGKTVLFRDSTRILGREAQIASVTSHHGRLYFLMSDPASARDLYVLDGAVPTQLTRLNQAALARWALSKPETLRFKSFDGGEVEGWLYPPTTGAARWPLVLSIHGGPHGMHGYAFNPSVQFHAGQGYALLLINPRGSSGYGQKFSDGCLNNWGGGDYKDLMAGVDYALKRYPQIDPQRLGVMGGSYGGFMTNWVITQTTRFKAAVSSASVSNLISFYATSLYQDLVHAEFNGFPWAGSNFETLWKWSPLRYAANATTPTLFIHGEQDNDVHITQAEEMYTALRRRGIEAVLARYPREGHGFREPAHNLDRLIRTQAWLDRFLQPR